MFRYLVLLSLALAVNCQICCIPQQWEGNQGSLTAMTADNGPSVITQSINMSYDGLNGRIAASEYASTTDGQTNVVAFIMDFVRGIQYVADENGCVKTSLTGNFADQTCIPNEAKLVKTGRLGVGSTALNVSTYSFTRGTLTVSETVTTSGCIPVSEGIYGEFQGNYFMQLLGFTGITPGIKNPAVFTPPASCNGGQVYQSNIPNFGVKRSKLLRTLSHILPLNDF